MWWTEVTHSFDASTLADSSKQVAAQASSSRTGRDKLYQHHKEHRQPRQLHLLSLSLPSPCQVSTSDAATNHDTRRSKRLFQRPAGIDLGSSLCTHVIALQAYTLSFRLATSCTSFSNFTCGGKTRSASCVAVETWQVVVKQCFIEAQDTSVGDG